ncbi:MAG: TraB/GumN family protein [Spartobacteria bacterium]
MKKSCSSLSILGCAFVAAFSTLNPSAKAATACVWRVTNAPAPFYLVGTMHSLSGHDYPLPKAYEQSMRDSQQFLFEIDPDRRSGEAFSKEFAAAAAYPKGDDIRRHIHPQTWDFLAKRFRESNRLGDGWWFGDQFIPGLQNIRPWAIAFYLWGIRGYSDVRGDLGVDNHIAFQARRHHKACGGLETNTDHVEVLRGMADIDAELLLLDTLVRGDKRKQVYEAMREGWKRGDLAPMEAEMKRSRDLNLGGEIRLLDYRNLRWIPKIVGAIKSGVPTSIVVGTGHFCGPNNVRELLEKKGYKLEQL